MSVLRAMATAPRDGRVVGLVDHDYSGIVAGYWGKLPDPDPEDGDHARWLTPGDYPYTVSSEGADKEFAGWFELPEDVVKVLAGQDKSYDDLPACRDRAEQAPASRIVAHRR